MNIEDQPKKKVSAFEYVIMQAAKHPEIDQYEPYTEQERLKQREDNLSEQFSKMRIKHKE